MKILVPVKRVIDYNVKVRGKVDGSASGLNAVVVGRSNIVGKPMAQLPLGAS